MTEFMDIRDFVYLDIERLKSIIAQIEGGLVEGFSESEKESGEVSSGLKGKILGLIETSVGGKFLWEKQENETKTLHDHIYNKVEDALKETELLIRIPENIAVEDMINEEYRSMLGDTSFILATGKVKINDYSRIETLLERWGDLTDFVAECNVEGLPNTAQQDQKARSAALKKAKGDMHFNKKLLDGFARFIDTFHKGKLIIKMVPFDDYTGFRLVGNLDRELLRDDISSIIYKYSTAPVSSWTMFGQIASIPSEEGGIETGESMFSNSDIEVAFQRMFDSARDMENMIATVVYPEIAVTPIAIYRG